MVADEILRVSKSSPSKVRPHGVTRSGTLYQSWIALFPRSSAPRPGFRLFNQSGVAILHKARKSIEQCKRCLGFHATRGCSRTLACSNCGSTMHSPTECKALSRCRNCGGPQKSDSRSCLACPTRSGPITKEQLVTIRQMSQREYYAVCRARAANIISQSSCELSAPPSAEPLLNEVVMLEDTAEELTNLQNQL